jgi:tetratricopeptide (TPR) repeat protein
LLESGESEDARNGHFDYFYNLAKSAEPEFGGPHAREWVERLSAEHDNLRAALEWGLEKNLGGVLRMGPFMFHFWMRQGHEEEGRQIIRDALSRAEKLPVPPADAGLEWKKVLGAAWSARAMLAYSQGDNARATESARRAAELAREVGDNRSLAVVLGFQGSSLMIVGESEKAAGLLEEGMIAGRASGDKLALGLPMGMYGQVLSLTGGSVEAAREHSRQGAALMEESGDRWVATMGLLGMAMGAKYRGDRSEARALFSAIEPVFRDLGDRHRTNMARSELAHIDRENGDLDKAQAAYRETILEWKRLGHRAAIAHQLECFASLAQAREQGERAARLFGAAEALREKINIPMTPLEKREYDGQVAELRAGMDQKLFASAWAAGRALSMDQAISDALQTKIVAADVQPSKSPR